MNTHPRFDVFVDGTHDRSLPGLSKAASGLAPLLSLPAEQVTKLLEGRFRVGMAVDEQTAQSMARNLTALGARVVIAPSEAKARSMAPATAGSVAPATARPPGPSAAPPVSSPPKAQAERPRAPTAAFGSRQGNHDDDGGISIGDMLDPNQASPQFVANPAPSAPAQVAVAHASSLGPTGGASPFGDDISLGESALSVEDLPPPPPAPSRPAPHAQAARPTARPAAPATPAPDAHGGHSDDPFAPPPDGDEAALDLAVDAATAAAPIRPPAATATGQTSAVAAAPAEGTAAAKATQPKSKRYVREEPIVTAKGILFAVLALALGAIPGHIYANSVDRGQIVRLQNEMQDLTVNPWKQETRKRQPQAVRQEIVDVRTRATWFMMVIWAVTTALLAAAAFAFLL